MTLFDSESIDCRHNYIDSHNMLHNYAMDGNETVPCMTIKATYTEHCVHFECAVYIYIYLYN